MARPSTMPTVPDDVMLDGVSRSWSCAGIEVDRNQRPAHASFASEDACARASHVQSPSGYVQADVSGRTVGEVMRLPTKFPEHAPLAAAVELFADGRVRLAVVVTKQNKPLGVVTPAHVLRIVKRSFGRLGGVTVLDAATSSGAFLTDTTSIRDAAERFATDDLDALVVVSRDGILVGVLMACDLPLVVNWA